MKQLLKENLVLIVGVSLPLLLTLIFFVATQFDRVTTDPPRHSVVYASNYYANNTNAPYRFIVKDNTLRFKYSPPEDKDNRHWGKPRLYVYNPATDVNKEIELPEIEDPDEKLDIVIPDLAATKITTIQTSPDGYTFEYDYRGHGNLMTELFGGGGFHSRSRYVLRKGSYGHKIPGNQLYSAQFIAWVIDAQESGHDSR